MQQQEQIFFNNQGGNNQGPNHFVFPPPNNNFCKNRAMSINYQIPNDINIQHNLPLKQSFTSFDMAFNDLKAKKITYEESLNEISMENVLVF